MADCVYFIQAEGGGPIKIGRAANARARLKALQTGSGAPLILLATQPGGAEQERALHILLKKHRLRGEWFAPHADVLKVVEAATAEKPVELYVNDEAGQVEDRAEQEEAFLESTLPLAQPGGRRAWIDMLQFVLAHARLRNISPSEALVRVFIEQAPPEMVETLRKKIVNG
jgi:hypothetical protein